MSPAIAFGSVMHVGLEEIYRADIFRSDGQAAIAKWEAAKLAELADMSVVKTERRWVPVLNESDAESYEAEIREICGRARRVIKRYYEKYISDGKRWEFLAVEQAYRIPLDAGSGRKSSLWDLVFRPDIVARDKVTGQMWVWDHKTSSVADKFRSRLGLEGRPQMSVYLGALQKVFGRYFTGVVYNFIRSKEPVIPWLNKDGSMARKPHDTLPEIYEAVWKDAQGKLKAAGGRLMNWAEYEAHYDVLLRRGDSFLYRLESYVSEGDQRMALQEMWRAARMIAPLARLGWPRNLGACSTFGRSCPYRSICLDSAGYSEEQMEGQFVRRKGLDGAPEIPVEALAEQQEEEQDG